MGVLVLALALGFGFYACGRGHPNTASTSSTERASVGTSEREKRDAVSVPAATAPAEVDPAKVNPARVDFATQVRPILEARCQPCHFAGGKVYEHLPFDRPATIIKLGTKLFTRIKDENERRLIRAFLSQQSPGH